MRDISLSLPSVGEFSISEVRVGFFAMSLVYFMCMALLKMITCNSCHEYLLVRIHKCGTSRFRFMPSVLIISLENFVLFVCMFVSFAGNHISYKSTTFT